VGTNLYMLFVVIGFFGLLAYSIHQDEKRKADRRHADLPTTPERRRQDRRQESLPAYLAWAWRSLWSKPSK